MNRYPQDDISAPVGDWIMNTVRRNPEGLLVLAAGCALLMRGGSGKTSGFRTNIDRPYGDGTGHRPYGDGTGRGSGASRSGIADRVSDAANYVSDVKDRVADTASSYANYASDAAQNLSDQSFRLKQQAQSSLQSGMERMLREQPLAVAILGVAAGAAVAAVLPTTSVENQALGGVRETLADAANKVGENVMGAAGAAGERLKTVAAERGLTPDGLKEVARDVASTFSTRVTGNGADQASGENPGNDLVKVGSSSPSLVPNRTRPSDRGDR